MSSEYILRKIRRCYKMRRFENIHVYLSQLEIGYIQLLTETKNNPRIRFNQPLHAGANVMIEALPATKSTDVIVPVHKSQRPECCQPFDIIGHTGDITTQG